MRHKYTIASAGDTVIKSHAMTHAYDVYKSCKSSRMAPGHDLVNPAACS